MLFNFDRMGAPRSRFAAQFVTLLQLQTCCICLASPAESGNPNQENRKSKKSEKSSSGKSNNQDKQGGFFKNRELEQESNCKQIVESSKDFEIKSIQQNGQHDMKRRNVLDGKPRRPVKRPTTSSKIGENFYGR